MKPSPKVLKFTGNNSLRRKNCVGSPHLRIMEHKDISLEQETDAKILLEKLAKSEENTQAITDKVEALETKSSAA